MKIAFAIPALTGGGSENQMQILANGLAGNGLEVIILYSVLPLEIPVFNANVKLFHIKATSNYSISYLINLRRAIRQEEPDIILSWITLMDVMVGLIHSINNSFKWVIREGSDKSKRFNSYKLKFRKRLAYSASLIVGNSINGLNYWNENRFSSKRILIRNGFNFPQVVLNEEAKNKSSKIVYVGRFEKSKNIESLVRAFAALGNKKLKLVLIGEGSLKLNIESLCETLQIASQVLLPGYLGKEQVYKMLQEAKVFCSLSLHEGMPNAVVEAMYVGNNLVLSNIPAHNELADSKIALFVDPTDIKEIKLSLLRAMHTPVNIKLLKNKALEFDESTMVKKYMDVFEKIN